MATKNLARTIIEGGRHKGNKWDRRNSHAEERARVKNYLKEVTLDPENYEEYDPEPIQHVYKGFDDKLGPIYRWLGRQVGKVWDEVRSELFQTFDTRTTAGRHIIFDHLLRSVDLNPETRDPYRYGPPEDPYASYSDNDFYVDADGILQKKRHIRRRYRNPVPQFDNKQLANWLNGRIVGKVGNKFFWFTPADKNEKRGGYARIWRLKWGYPTGYYYYSGDISFYFQYLSYEIIYKKDSVGQPIIEDGRMVELERVPKWTNGKPMALRQDRKLTDKEVEYWNTIPEFYQTKILEQSPTYPEDLKPKRRYY